MWPAELQLPLPDIHLWGARVVAAGRKLPGAQRALPVDCFVGRLASRNTRTGEGAMQALFRLDVDQVTDVAAFVSEWSGVDDVRLGSPRGAFTRRPVELTAAGWQQLLTETEATEGRLQAKGLSPDRDVVAAARSHCIGRWIATWFDGAELVAQQPVFDDLDTAGIDADLVNKRGNDIYIKSRPLGSRDQQWISPIVPTAVQFRQQRIYLLVIMVDHTTGTVRTRLRERLTDEILALHPSIDLAGTFMSEPGWLDDALPTLRRRIDRAAARVMNRYRPTFFELEPGSSRPGIVPYTWVALFNDLNAGHVPRICGNTECSAPFTRQVGQAAHGQSRRDATYCSKTCADRAAYLRRRGN